MRSTSSCAEMSHDGASARSSFSGGTSADGAQSCPCGSLWLFVRTACPPRGAPSEEEKRRLAGLFESFTARRESPVNRGFSSVVSDSGREILDRFRYPEDVIVAVSSMTPSRTRGVTYEELTAAFGERVSALVETGFSITAGAFR